MADASIYGEFVKANQPFATLGEIAASKQQRETTRINQQIAQDTLKLRQQEMADKQKAAEDDAADREAISQAFQQHTGPDGPNKRAILQTLYTSGRIPAAQKAEAIFAKALKEAGEAHKLELENGEKESVQIGRYMEAMNPQNAAAISSMIKTKWPDFAQTFQIDPSQPFDPAKRDAAIAAVGHKKEYLANQKAALDNQKDPIHTFLELTTLVPDAEHYTSDAWEFAKAHQITDELRGMGFSEQFDPSVAQRAKNLALGVKEVATIEGRQADDKRQAETAAETARHNRATEGAASARLAFDRSKPQGGATTGGTRPITSGDANRLSEIQDSLNDLGALRKALLTTKDATGTRAAAGAMLWTPISNATGIGIAAKQRQATIDRVKQVIGKALEGGVLRKEDENKYEKILPTIYDSEDVAEAKLKGLEDAITKKWDTHLSSLEDAGYNTSRYRSRNVGAAPPQPGAKLKVGKYEVVAE